MLRLFIDLKVYRKDIGLILQKSWDLPDHNIIHACIYFCSSRPNIPIDCYLQQWEWVQIKDRLYGKKQACKVLRNSFFKM
jgi:hypothetical protein